MPVFDIIGALFGTSLAATWAWWLVDSELRPCDIPILNRLLPCLGFHQVCLMLAKVNLLSDSLPTLQELIRVPREGIIMGFPTTVFMNLGMITGWAILSPLAKHKGWAPGPVSSSTDGSRGWIVSPDHTPTLQNSATDILHR